MLQAAATLALAFFVGSTAAAPPTQTVFKCIQEGKTVYTDEPCLNGQEVDTTPTKGMDTATGQRRLGADAVRDIQRESLAEAVRPLTGMNREQFDRAGRRTKLSGQAQQECKRLDVAIPALQAQRGKPGVAEQLLAEQKQFKALGC